MWVKTTNAPSAKVSIITGSTSVVVAEESIPVTQHEWNRISYIIRTEGDLKDRFVRLNISSEFYVDDVSLYKLDYDYGKKCYDAGKMFDNSEVMKKDSVDLTVETAKSTVDLTVENDYFVPYGAFAKQDGTMAEKLGNGRFYVENAGDYSYTQFKYPTGIVGTFGASAKSTGEQTGIQFGSLVTDNLSIKENGTGTLLFRGDFDAFCKTFPTKTRKEVVEYIYEILKAQEEEPGSLEKKGVKFYNKGEAVVVMYVPQTKYMWKNSEQTQLQYAVRVWGITENELAHIDFTAIGYVTTKDGDMVFSNELKTRNYTELLPKK